MLLVLCISLIIIPIWGAQNNNSVELLNKVSSSLGVQSIILGYLESDFIPHRVVHNTGVYAYFPDLQRIAEFDMGSSSNEKSRILIRDVTTRKTLHTIVLDDLHKDIHSSTEIRFYVHLLAIHPHGNYITASGSRGRSYREWELRPTMEDYAAAEVGDTIKDEHESSNCIITCNVQQQKYLDIHPEGLDLSHPIESLAYAANGYLCIGNNQGIFIFTISEWTSADNRLISYVSSPDISHDTHNFKILCKCFIPSQVPIRGLAVSGDRQFLADNGNDQASVMLDGVSLLRVKEKHAIKFVFSPDNSSVIIVNSNKSIYLYNLKFKSIFLVFPAELYDDNIRNSIAFSTHGNYLAMGNTIYQRQDAAIREYKEPTAKSDCVIS